MAADSAASNELDQAAAAATEPTVEAQGDDAEEIEEGAEYTFPVKILLPEPTYSAAYPPLFDEAGKKVAPPTSYTFQTATPEILQDLRFQIQDSPSGYFLGPFSFRLPVPEGRKKGELVNTGRENLEIRLGEKLSDFVELGEVFGSFEKGIERVLEVVREPFSEAEARAQIIRLRDYLSQGSDAQDPAALGLHPGASLYEMVRDGLVVVEEKEAEERPAANGSAKANGKSKKAAPTPAPASKARTIVKLVKGTVAPFSETDDWAASPLSQFHARPIETPNPPAALKTLTVSTWNPPPPQYRSKGHLVYLALTTLEGESVQLTGTVRGWFVSKSTTVSFDPMPRPAPKNVEAHSLIDLLHGLSPAFTSAFHQLLAGGAAASNVHPPREILATAPIQQAQPAHPWLVKPQAAHVADALRQQLAYLHTGAVGVEGLEAARDWNDELQQGRELGKETMQDKVNREKHLARVHAEFTNACVRGVVSVARGDVIPLNPHEKADAHMFFYHNILFTKGCDSIESFSHLGGDAAAHAASGKDAAGIRALNQLDVDGVCCLGHTVVDWAGERWVCQTYLPGIFSKRLGEDDKGAAAAAEGAETEGAEAKKDTSNPLIVYGLDFEAGPTSIKWDASFHKSMEKIADGFRLAKHEVPTGPAAEDKVELWSSFDVKGLLGTDGRKYVLDAFRLSPVDVEFLQKDAAGTAFTAANVADRTGALKAAEGEDEAVADKAVPADEQEIAAYPHRLVLLRQELLDGFWEAEFRKWATDRASKREKKAKPAAVEAAEPKADAAASEEPAAEGETKDEAAPAEAEAKPEEEERVVVQLNGDIHVHQPNGEIEVVKAEPGARFDLRFNPDAWVDLKAGADADKDTIASTINDEADASVQAVRNASIFLRSTVIPTFVLDVLTNRDSSMDGVSLTRSLHRRGINMRYLGAVTATVEKIAADRKEGEAIGNLEALKVILKQEMVFRACKRILRSLIKGLLVDEWAAALSHFLNCLVGTAVEANPKPVVEALAFAAEEPAAWTKLTPASLQAEVIAEVQARFRYTMSASYFGEELKRPQIVRELASRYAFQLASRDYQFEAAAAAEGEPTSEEAVAAAKKRKASKKAGIAQRTTTFVPEDVVAFVPAVKDAEPQSSASEETLEAGKVTINRGDRQGGLELMHEGVLLYETIHSIFHKDVARAYNSYAIAVHQVYRQALQQQLTADPKTEQPPAFGAELAEAIRLQRQAVIIAERTLGLDHHETISFYQNLAMLESLSEDVETSLKIFRHVLALGTIVYGEGHPEQLILLTNVGNLLSMASQFQASVKLFEKHIELASQVFGPSSIQVASTHNLLCQTLFCVQDLEGATVNAEAAYKIYLERLGESDPSTEEAKQLLDAFKTHAAQTALAEAQNARRVASIPAAAAAASSSSRRMLQQQAPASSATAPSARRNQRLTSQEMAQRAQTTAAAPAAGAGESGIGSRGHLEIDDLVKFVGGQGDKKNKKRAAKE